MRSSLRPVVLSICTLGVMLLGAAPASAAEAEADLPTVNASAAETAESTSAPEVSLLLLDPERLVLVRSVAQSHHRGRPDGAGGPSVPFSSPEIGEACFGNCTCTSCECAGSCSLSECRNGCNGCWDELDEGGSCLPN